ncbi:MAG: hypothetical protein DWQ08_10295, partial [Proteobacteria bacterium]
MIRRRGVADSPEDVPVKPRSDEIWAILPGEDLVTAEIAVPTRNRRKLMQAIPFALEDRLTEDVDSFHFILIHWTPGSSAVVGIVSREIVRRLREDFSARGWRLSGMVADYQLLPIHPQAQITLADHGNGRTSMLRANGTGATLDTETLSVWWDSFENADIAVAVNNADLARQMLSLNEGDVREWDIGADFTSWLRHRSRRVSIPNMLPVGDDTSGRGRLVPGLRAAIVLMSLAVLGKIGIDGYEYVQLERAHDRLSKEIESLFRQTFPQETRVVNARSQFRQKLVEALQGANASDDFQSLLAAVAPAVSGSRVSLEEVSFREEMLEVLCVVRNFAELDNLQKSFSRPGVNVELVGSGSLD